LRYLLDRVRSVYFLCANFPTTSSRKRKAFLSRPKLDGPVGQAFVYNDGETLEGVVPNEILLSLLDNGLQINIARPELFHGPVSLFRAPALTEVTVLGVVGIARRKAGCRCRSGFATPAFSTK